MKTNDEKAGDSKDDTLVEPNTDFSTSTSRGKKTEVSFHEQTKLTEFDIGRMNSDLDYWDFAGSPTQHSTHGIHTYLAAMIPYVAKKAIQITKPKKLLDPFCGGGAVLVESINAGVPCVGVDTNPLAIIVSKAKTTHMDAKPLRNQLRSILDEAVEYDGTLLQFAKNQKMDYWYKDYTFKPLSALSISIRGIQDPTTKEFFQCMMSAVARDVSLTYRNEIRLRRLEPPDYVKFNPDVIRVFERNCLEAIRRVSELPETESCVINDNVLDLPFKDEEFTTIVCSPPYGDERNGVPYIQFSKNMLFWLGYGWNEVLAAKKNTLGWVNKRTNIPVVESPTLKSCLMKISEHPVEVKEAKAFYYDYGLALREMARVVEDKIVIVIGQRVLMNTVFDNAQITIELLSNLGVEKIKHSKRKLPSKRLPKMRDFGAAIDEEHILFFDVSRKKL